LSESDRARAAPGLGFSRRARSRESSGSQAAGCYIPTPETRSSGRDGGGGRGFGGGGGGFGGGGGGVILQQGDYIYLSGTALHRTATDRFLDRLDLKTLRPIVLSDPLRRPTRRFIAPIDDDAKTILTEYETSTEPPNYYVRDLAAGTKRAITQFKDPRLSSQA